MFSTLVVYMRLLSLALSGWQPCRQSMHTPNNHDMVHPTPAGPHLMHSHLAKSSNSSSEMAPRMSKVIGVICGGSATPRRRLALSGGEITVVAHTHRTLHHASRGAWPTYHAMHKQNSIWWKSSPPLNARRSILSSVAYVRHVQWHADSSWSPLPSPLLPSLLLYVPSPSPFLLVCVVKRLHAGLLAGLLSPISQLLDQRLFHRLEMCLGRMRSCHPYQPSKQEGALPTASIHPVWSGCGCPANGKPGCQLSSWPSSNTSCCDSCVAFLLALSIKNVTTMVRDCDACLLAKPRRPSL